MKQTLQINHVADQHDNRHELMILGIQLDQAHSENRFQTISKSDLVDYVDTCHNMTELLSEVTGNSEQYTEHRINNNLIQKERVNQ